MKLTILYFHAVEFFILILLSIVRFTQYPLTEQEICDEASGGQTQVSVSISSICERIFQTGKGRAGIMAYFVCSVQYMEERFASV